jgi:hypothetical protein
MSLRARFHRMSFVVRPFVAFSAVALFFAMKTGADERAPNRSAALADVLSRDGYAASAEDVVWLSGPSGVTGSLSARALAVVRARAASAGSTYDLYLVHARLSPEGQLLEVGEVYDVTKTIGVDEDRPVASGRTIAYTTSLDGAPQAVHVMKLDAKSIPAEFNALQKLQLTLTNLQTTGERGGLAHDVYALGEPHERVSLTLRGNALDVDADGKKAGIDVTASTVTGDAALLRATPDQAMARPAALVPWAVDRVRGISWFGEEKMQWVKAIAFKLAEVASDAKQNISHDTGAEDVAKDIEALKRVGGSVSFTDPEIGWPPAPMKPIIHPPLPGEGEWIGLDKDPFITQTPGAPPAFLTSFIRTDPKKPATRIYVTLWDPRQIALHMEAGTVEPVGAAGEVGPGLIPRTPEVIRRVVAGFNGGFQATHGEFGMQANGIEYLPPKPFAATVFEMKDGSTAFGAWPRSQAVPDDVLSYRQNLTPIVQNDKFNPWGRAWWGGTPIGWYDNIHSTRSGVCLTKENYVGYFYGIDIAPNVLADGMLAARCAFGVHLDMNPGLAGFEFYNVQSATNFQPLGRPLQSDWEYEGTIKELPEFRFRARRMIKSMAHMNFPQYIHRDGRDFFYLTARYVLPGADLPAPEPRTDANEGKFRVKGLPQHGFPYALAIAETRLTGASSAKVRVVRIDPRAVTGAPQGHADNKPIVASIGRARDKASVVGEGDMGLFHVGHVFTIGKLSQPPEGGVLLARGAGDASEVAKNADAVVGIGDEDGMLQWMELAPGASPSAESARAMTSLLAQLGCSTKMWLVRGTRVSLGGSLDAAAQPSTVPPPDALLVRADAPGAHPTFADTPVVGPEVWQNLQAQRVRYFKKPEPAASGSSASSAPSPSGATPPTPPSLPPSATQPDARTPTPTSTPTSTPTGTPTNRPHH